MEKITKKCGRFEFEDYQAEIKALLEKAINEYEQAAEMQKHYDLMISDLLHQVEDESMGGVELVRWAVKVREAQRERRVHKVQRKYLSKFVGCLKSKGNQAQLNKILDKNLLEYDDQPYKPRVLKEEKQ